MAGMKDPHRFAGKMGIDAGPIPIGHWVQQPSVQATMPHQKDTSPNAGKAQKQGNGVRKGKE